MTTDTEKMFTVLHAKGASYVWAVNALAAIRTVKDTDKITGAMSARIALLKEWNRPLTHTGHLHPYTRPCNECATPVNLDTHREELGLCLDCSNAYWNELDN